MVGRRTLIVLLVAGSAAVGGVAGAVVGVPSLSGASEGSSSTTVPGGSQHKPMIGARQDLLGAAAQALHLTTDQLRQKLSDGKTTIADVAQQQHVDINTVIDAMASSDRQAIENFVNNPLPQFSKPFGGRGGRMGRGMRPFPFFGGGAILDAAAKDLGITTQELQTDLRNGQSIASIAKSKNVDVNKVIDDMVSAAQTKLNNLGDKLKQAITNFVNGTRPDGGPAFGRLGGPLGGFGSKSEQPAA